MQTKQPSNLRRALWLSLLTVAAVATTQTMQAANYTLVPDDYGMTLKSPEGRVVFTYMTRKPEKTNLAANSTCCFHPLNTPSGERLSDLAPGDHHHHRGVFLAWHSMEFREKADFSKFGPLGPTRGFMINRGDFWGWGQFAPTTGRVITNRSIKLAGTEARHATVEIRNDWQIDGKTMMDELTLATVREQGGVYVMDLDYQLTPVCDLVLGHTAFGGFCVRARNDGESWYADPKGKINLPDPHYSVPELNWPASEWSDYTIKLTNGKTLGVTVLDHPANPPATWHNPRYVWMVNPCIVAKKPVMLKAQAPFHLRYRLIIHDGLMPADLVKELNREWRKGKN
ncbi:MAG: DUF6807 family protein [Verrucomicrobiia bacterium]